MARKMTTKETAKSTKQSPKKQKKEHDSSKSQKTVMVIGDLFIDENWLMATADNYHSTGVGDTHYTSLIKGPDSFVLSVCGIANVIKVLLGGVAGDNEDGIAKESFRDKFQVIGIGAWNPEDTGHVKRILCPVGKKKLFATPYTLTDNLGDFGCDKSEVCSACDYNYELRNLVKDGKDNIKSTSTNRIYRLYEGFGSDHPKLRYRFDWQIDLEKTHVDYSVLDEINNVEALVIVDHGKGVITRNIIDRLLESETFRSAKWYVRTKLDSPRWFEAFNDNPKTLRLIVADQQLINYTYGERMWYRSTSLCRASLELLGNMLGLQTYKHGAPVQKGLIKSESAAILFEKNWAIAGSRHKKSAVSASDDDARIYYMPKSSYEAASIRVGRTSIFFNSLIYRDLMKNELENSKIPIAMEWALRNMTEWMKRCTAAWRNENPSALSGPFEEVISWNKNVDSEDDVRKGSIEQNYNDSWKEWNLSSTDYGIIRYKVDSMKKVKRVLDKKEDDNSDEIVKELHLWRSYGTLQNYVCPGGEKRSNINELVSSLNEYRKRQDPVVPFNCLFIAEPGWGKSYLAQCVSEYFDFDFLSYSIAQMASTRELIDSFKEIASSQKRSKKKLLVFMDEIDATINNQVALGLLLSPMWDGKFKSEGYTNRIDPCIWIFACTLPLSAIRKLPKGRDFLSRINGPLINIDFLSNEERENIHNQKDEKSRNGMLMKLLSNIDTRTLNTLEYYNNKRTEIVYQTVNLLNRQFGPISSIDLEVLELFYDILPINGMRSLQIFVSKFNNIAKGIIEKTNVPNLLDEGELEGQIELLRKKTYEEKFHSKSVTRGETIKIKLQT